MCRRVTRSSLTPSRSSDADICIGRHWQLPPRAELLIDAQCHAGRNAFFPVDAPSGGAASSGRVIA